MVESNALLPSLTIAAPAARAPAVSGGLAPAGFTVFAPRSFWTRPIRLQPAYRPEVLLGHLPPGAVPRGDPRGPGDCCGAGIGWSARGASFSGAPRQPSALWRIWLRLGVVLSARIFITCGGRMRSGLRFPPGRSCASSRPSSAASSRRPRRSSCRCSIPWGERRVLGGCHLSVRRQL